MTLLTLPFWLWPLAFASALAITLLSPPLNPTRRAEKATTLTLRGKKRKEKE
jgi:hypothetical protein